MFAMPLPFAMPCVHFFFSFPCIVSAMHCHAVPYRTVPCCTVPCRTVPCRAVAVGVQLQPIPADGQQEGSSDRHQDRPKGACRERPVLSPAVRSIGQGYVLTWAGAGGRQRPRPAVIDGCFCVSLSAWQRLAAKGLDCCSRRRRRRRQAETELGSTAHTCTQKTQRPSNLRTGMVDQAIFLGRVACALAAVCCVVVCQALAG